MTKNKEHDSAGGRGSWGKALSADIVPPAGSKSDGVIWFLEGLQRAEKHKAFISQGHTVVSDLSCSHMT